MERLLHDGERLVLKRLLENDILGGRSGVYGGCFGPTAVPRGEEGARLLVNLRRARVRAVSRIRKQDRRAHGGLRGRLALRARPLRDLRQGHVALSRGPR